jgi:hypothetical protein
MSEQAVVISVGDLQDVIDILESGRTWDAVGTLARVLSSGVKAEREDVFRPADEDDPGSGEGDWVSAWVAVPSTEEPTDG